MREKLDRDRAYLGRKPSYTRAQLDRAMLGQEAVARIAKETRLTRQTVYRIKEAALAAWERR
jgi:hypothetical protein